MSRVLVIAAGNEMRGDDGAGPRLLAFVASRAWPQVHTLFDFQFQVEHAVDAAAAELVLFIDAHVGQAEPLVLTEVTQGVAPSAASHALAPEEVVGVAHQLGLTCPPCFVLSVAGRDFSLGAGMSATVANACKDAESLLTIMLDAPEASRWRALCLTPHGIGARV